MVWQKAFDGGTGYMYSNIWQSPWQPDHKTSKRSQPEITIQYLYLLNHYVDTIFVLPNLGTDQGLSTESGDQNILEILHKLT